MPLPLPHRSGEWFFFTARQKGRGMETQTPIRELYLQVLQSPNDRELLATLVSRSAEVQEMMDDDDRDEIDHSGMDHEWVGEVLSKVFADMFAEAQRETP